MKVIFEPDIERMDFLELAITEEEYQQIRNGGLVYDYDMWGCKSETLNIYIRLMFDRERKEHAHPNNRAAAGFSRKRRRKNAL